MATEDVKVLVIGPTGLLGKHIVKASVTAGHPTFILVRSSTLANPAKGPILDAFRKLGVTVLEGSLEDDQSVLNALKQVDVVISAIGGESVHKQFSLLPLIKEAGTIKRFFPSEFGLDVDRVPLLPQLQKYLGVKSKLRRAIEEAGIPHTFVDNVSFAGAFLSTLWQYGRDKTPRDRVEMWGDGEGKVSFVDEDDIATYTIKAIMDPRTLNKTLSIRPQLISPNEVVAIWEKKLGHTLEKIYITEEQLLQKIADAEAAPHATGPAPGVPLVASLCIRHAIFIKAGNSVEASPHYVEAGELYPDYKFVTVDEYLSRLV